MGRRRNAGIGIHNGIIADLEARLREKYPDDIISTTWEYPIGEVDVLRYNLSRDQYYMYEVKCNHHKKAWAKANEQYQRLCRYFKNKSIRGIYVTQQGITRMQPHGATVGSDRRQYGVRVR